MAHGIGLRRLRVVWLPAVLAASLCLGPAARGTPPVASNIVVVTSENQAVTIPLTTNVFDAGGYQTAILQVSTPAHGSAVINSNGFATTPQLSNLFSFAAFKLSNSVVQVVETNVYPWYTMTNGDPGWETSDETGWTVGFFPGAMWYIFQQTGDPNFKKWAQEWTSGLTNQEIVTNTDDIGFMLNCSVGTGYRVTGATNNVYSNIIVTTAHSLSNRYNAVCHSVADDHLVGGGQLEVIIDTLMNTELLYHGRDLNGDSTLAAKATNHATRAMTNQIRGDGSTYQLVDYSLSNGSVRTLGNRAISDPAATWARGQSWAIYGFTMAYRETTNNPFLAAAQRTANYYISNAPPDYVPYYDYQAPGIPNAPRDSSAAAIALPALVQLSELTTNMTDSAADWQEANNIFQSLASTNYLANATNSSGILLHGTGETPDQFDPQTNVSLIYADYYFIEAMRRYSEAYSFTNVTYTPKTGFNGNDSFTYQVCDSDGQCSTGTVTVVVLNPGALSPFNAKIALAPGTKLPVISFPTTTGYVYQVDYLNSLVAPFTWTPLTSNIAGSGSTLSVTDASPPPFRVYRAGGH
jgi:hypothetical protein